MATATKKTKKTIKPKAPIKKAPIKKTTKTKVAEKEVKPKNGLILETVISRSLYTTGFYLYIYKTRDQMISAIKKKHGARNACELNDGGACGVVFEADDIYVDKVEKEEYQIFAEMFLNEADLDMDILAHECVHTTFILEREVLRFIGLYDGNDWTGEAPEERFAYTIGDFVDAILKKCIDNGIQLKFRAERKEKREQK